jgi:hypothetical protein
MAALSDDVGAVVIARGEYIYNMPEWEAAHDMSDWLWFAEQDDPVTEEAKEA